MARARTRARVLVVLVIAFGLCVLVPRGVPSRDLDLAAANAPAGTQEADARAAAEEEPAAEPVPSPAPEPDGRQIERLSGEDRVGTAVAVARATYLQAPVAVLASAHAYADALVAAPYAAHVGGPLLLTPPDRLPDEVAGVLQDLDVRRVVLMGGEAAISGEVAEQLRVRHRVGRIAGADRYETAVKVAMILPMSDEAFLATGIDFPDGLAVGPLAVATASPILLTLPDRLPAATAGLLAERDPARVTVVGGEGVVSPDVEAALRADGREVRRLAGASRHATSVAIAEAGVAEGLARAEVWLANGERFPDALAAGAAVGARGGVLLLVDGTHLGAATPVADWLRAHAEELRRIVVLGGPGAIAADAAAQIEAVLAGRQLPRGGRSLLPEHRLVALYGHSSTAALGSLGEQPPEEAAQRAVTVATPFGEDGKPVLPTFEFIATVATAGPGTSGLYRAPTDPAIIQRSLDAVRTVRGYLVLDIQPGRSDFLTESRRYEHFLVQPDVGLALDPEWRMGPNQRPGETVGWVHASEVNAVSAWLADLVARHALPEKLLLLHQFQDRMIQERHLLEPREGLAIAVQMDGFGSRSQKLATYARTRIAPPFFNGFKLFYDEDSNLFQPHEVLALDPVPDFVSYQ